MGFAGKLAIALIIGTVSCLVCFVVSHGVADYAVKYLGKSRQVDIFFGMALSFIFKFFYVSSYILSFIGVSGLFADKLKLAMVISIAILSPMFLYTLILYADHPNWCLLVFLSTISGIGSIVALINMRSLKKLITSGE